MNMHATTFKAEATTSRSMAVVMQRYRMAEAALNDFIEGIHDPAIKRYETEKERLPQYVTERQVDLGGGCKSLSTEDDTMVILAHWLMRNPRAKRERDPGYWDAMQELVDLADKRQAELDELSSKHDLAQIRATDDYHGSNLIDAQNAVIKHPVRSIHDLAAKAAVISEAMLWDCENVGKEIAANIAELASHA